jgi:hypothetical protein
MRRQPTTHLQKTRYPAIVNPSVCPRHGGYARGRYIEYTGTTNPLDFTGCTVLVTLVDEQLDFADHDSGMKDAVGQTIPASACDLDKAIRGRYDPVVYNGLPLES